MQPDPSFSRAAHGRTFADWNQVYMLPADQLELERLSLQHQLLLAILDRLYPCDSDLAHKVLAPNPDSPPQILDIGSGSGIWCIQMSIEFPHARVVGVDIARSNPRHVPLNCTFDAGDVTRGLSRYHGQFNFVHCRCMAGAVRDFPALIQDIGRCLRPGGILVMGEGDLKVYNEQKYLCPIRLDRDDDPTHSWLARMLFEVTQLNSRRSVNSMGWQLEELIRAAGQFTGVNYKRCFAPIGWDGDGSLKNAPVVQRLLKHNCYDFVRAWRPLLLMNGFKDEVVDTWIRNIDYELHEPTVLRLYTAWHYAWAIKAPEARNSGSPPSRDTRHADFSEFSSSVPNG